MGVHGELYGEKCVYTQTYVRTYVPCFSHRKDAANLFENVCNYVCNNNTV